MSSRPLHLTTLSSIHQVASRLGLCVNSVRTLIEEGRLTRVKVGARAVRIRDSEVEQYIARQAAGPSGIDGGAS